MFPFAFSFVPHNHSSRFHSSWRPSFLLPSPFSSCFPTCLFQRLSCVRKRWAFITEWFRSVSTCGRGDFSWPSNRAACDTAALLSLSLFPCLFPYHPYLISPLVCLLPSLLFYSSILLIQHNPTPHKPRHHFPPIFISGMRPYNCNPKGHAVCSYGRCLAATEDRLPVV